MTIRLILKPENNSNDSWRQILETVLIQEHKPGFNANTAWWIIRDVTRHHRRHVYQYRRVTWLLAFRATGFASLFPCYSPYWLRKACNSSYFTVL